MRFPSIPLIAFDQLRPRRSRREASLSASATSGNNLSRSDCADEQVDGDTNTLNSRSVGSHFEEPTALVRVLNQRQLQSPPASGRQPSIRDQHPHEPNDSQRNIRLSRKVASISQMLRDMYSLDLNIYGTENGLPEDEGDRKTMIEEANRLFMDVVLILDDWEKERWTEEEMGIIDEIRVKAYNHDPRRHRPDA